VLSTEEDCFVLLRETLEGPLRWLNKAADRPSQSKSKDPGEVFKTRVLWDILTGADKQKKLVKCRM